MPGIMVREVRSAAEREAVFAFRYSVYVDEMRRAEPCADHDARTIVDPLDATGRLLAAFLEDGTVVGTARINFARDSDLSEYEGPYGMGMFRPFHPDATAIVTKLMVARRHRRGPAAFRLAVGCYRLGAREGIAYSFIDCNPHLKPFFQRFGFRQVMPDFLHPVYGRVHPLVLHVHDARHLRDTRALVCPAGWPAVEAPNPPRAGAGDAW